MELLLNLVWCLLTLGAFGAFAADTRRRQLLIKPLRATLALACALVLLFPVISASDDLHTADIVVEDSVKRLCVGLNAPPLKHVPMTFLPVLLTLLLLIGMLQMGRLAVLRWSPKSLSLALPPLEGRAPPVQS
jgi:hypothetical protein